MRLGDDPAATILDLVQWLDPDTAGKPYEKGYNVGITRICFHVDNPEEVYKELKSRGAEFLGPKGYGKPPGGGRSTVFAWRDPDGNVLEIVGGMKHMVA